MTDSLNISSNTGVPSIEIPFPVVPKETEEMLNEKQLFDYQSKNKSFAKWLLVEGKEPRDQDGYAKGTAKRTVYRVGYFQRWLWCQKDEYIPVPTHDHADTYVEQIAYADYTNSHKAGNVNALKRYFKWRHHAFGEDEWSPDRTFTTTHQQPQDYLTKDERAKIREAALEYGELALLNH